MVEGFRRAGAASRVVLDMPEGGAAPSRLGPDALAILARDLVENALRHGDPQGLVCLGLAPDGALSVRDGGPVVPPDRLADLRRRSMRGGGREGSGLTIARAPAPASTRARPPRRAGGFEAVLSV